MKYQSAAYPDDLPTRASYRLQYFTGTPCTPSAPTSHDRYEIYIHVRGAAQYHLNGQLQPLEPMTAFVIPPGQVHGVVSDGPLTSYEALIIEVTPGLLAELSFRDCSLHSELDRIISLNGQRLLMNQEVWRNALSLAQGVKDDSPDLSPLELQISLGCLSTLLGVLCFARTQFRAPYITLATTEQTIRYIGSYIAQNFSGDCSLQHLSEQFSISKYHLARRFNAAFGMTLHQYVLTCRIAYAKRLLLQGEPLVAIAHACGFSDYSTFQRSFTRLTGVSPSQWRMENLHA